MKDFPVLETQRLVLRQLRDEDAEDVYSYFSKDEVMEFYDLRTFTDLRQALDLIRTWNNRYYKKEGIRWAIALKEDREKVVGTCGYHSWSKEHNRAEIGYELHPDGWGKGLMTEAVQAIVRYGSEVLALRRIEAFIHPKNTASKRILEKVGMESEGILRDYFFEKEVYVDAQLFSIINKGN